jgi:dienelactone hydrolase
MASARTRLSLALSLLLGSCADDGAASPAGGADPTGGDATTDARSDAAPRASMDAGLGVEGAATFEAGAAPRDASSAPASVAARAPATSRKVAVSSEAHLQEAPYFNITRPTDLSVLGGEPLPVVVWANGGCLRLDIPWQPLFERWAAAGFVVLSLSANPDGDPSGGLLSMFGSTTDAEHRALIDWVVAQNASGPYAGKLDVARIVVAGNSCGGVTALQTAAKDERPAAAFVLSGSSAVGSVDTEVMKAISIPVGYVIGGEEDIAGVNARADYAATREGLPAMVVSRRVGDHLTVSSDATVLPEEAEIALTWMDLALYGTRAAHDALHSKDVCATCTPGDWTLTAKSLATLVR